MKYIIGLKLAQDSSDAINEFIRSCSQDHDNERWGNFRPIHPNHPTIIPIGRRKNPLPNEPLHLTLPLENARLHVFNEFPRNHHSSLQLLFKNEYVQNRLFEMANIIPATAGKGARKRHRPRILLGFFCNYFNHNWISRLQIKEVNVVEQIAIPFDPAFPHYAHEYVEPQTSPWQIGLAS